MITLRSRLQRFFEDSGVNKTAFMKKVGISRTTLYSWLNGTINISPNIQSRIDQYLEQFNY